SVDHDRQVETRRHIEQSPEALAPAPHDRHRVRRVGQAIPRQPNFAESDQPRVLLGHLTLYPGEVLIGEVSPFRMKPERRPSHLPVGGSDLQRAGIAGGVTAYRHDAPDVMLDGAHDGVARVAEHRVLKMTVAVDYHARITAKSRVPSSPGARRLIASFTSDSLGGGLRPPSEPPPTPIAPAKPALEAPRSRAPSSSAHASPSSRH